MIEEKMIENSQTLKSFTPAIDTTPEEASKNVINSEVYSMKPDEYKSLSPELDKEINNNKRVPAQVTDTFTKFATEDTQQAAAVQGNEDVLDNFVRRMGHYWDSTVTVKNNNRDIVDLRFKEKNGGLTEDEQDQLAALNEHNTEIGTSAPKDLTGVEQVATDVVGGLYDMARSFTDNPEIIAGSAATLGAVGLGLGAVTGPGALATGLAGASTGAFVVGPAAVGMVDSYRQTYGLTYNSFMTSGEDITPERAANISEAVALASGAAGGLLGLIGGKSNPLVKKIADPKQLMKMIATNPKTLLKLEAIGGLVKAMSSEAAEEGFQSYIEKVGEKFGYGGDDEDDVEAMIDNLWKSAKMSSDELKEIGYEGAVGGLTGGAARGISLGVGKLTGKSKADLANYENQKALAEEREVTLQFKNTIDGMQADLAAAEGRGFKIKNKFIDKTFEAMGMDRTFFLDAQALEKHADTPEKKQALETLIATQELNEMAKQDGADFQINIKDLFKSDVLKEMPGITEDIKPTPKSETTAQAKENVKKFVEAQAVNDARRQELLNQHTTGIATAQAELEAFTQSIEGQDVTPELQGELERLQGNLEESQRISEDVQAELDALKEPVKDPRPFEDEFDYLDTETFTAIDGVLTQEEADALNQKDMLQTKLNVAGNVRAEVESEFDSLTNKLTAEQLKDQVKFHENNLSVVEGFKQKTIGKATRNKTNSEAANEITKNHKKKGFSPSAVDPKSLSEFQKEVLASNPDLAKKLKKRKFFVEGGIHIEESAKFNNVDNGDQLMEVIANTPNKKELAKLKKQQKLLAQNEIRQELKPLELDAINKEFGDTSNILKKQLDEFRGRDWSGFKKHFKKINKDPVNIAEVKNRAKTVVANMKIADINANYFHQAERTNRRLANESLLKGDPAKAYDHLEKAYVYHEMIAEATKARAKVEKHKAFWKNLESNKVIQATLHKAGNLEAINDVRSLLNLSGKDITKATEVELDNFRKYVAKQYAEGNYSVTIPKRLDVTSTSIRNITFDQYDSITETGKNILYKSRQFNKIEKGRDSRLTAISLDEMREQALEAAQANPNYDRDKSTEDYEKNMSLGRFILHKTASVATHTSNINWTTRELDAEQKDGWFYNAIAWPLQVAKDTKIEKNKVLIKDLDVVVKKYFGSEKKMIEETSKFVTIPELAKYDGIADKDGKIRIHELMVIQAYRGDASYHKDIANYRDTFGNSMKVADMEAILEKHLTEKHADFVQDFFINPFSRYTNDLVSLEQRTNGVDLEIVEGRSFFHRGKEMKGGYYPGQRTSLTAAQRAQIEQEKNDSKMPNKKNPGEDPYDFSLTRGLERTKQAHAQKRTGSERPMVLDIANVLKFHEEITHDLTHREVGKEVIDFVSDDIISEQIQNVIGKGKHENLLASVRDIVSKDSEKPDAGTTGRILTAIENVLAKFNSLHAEARIGLSPTSVITQGMSLITAAQSLGFINSVAPLVKNVGKTLSGGAVRTGKRAINSSFGQKVLHSRISQALNNLPEFESNLEYAKSINSDIEAELDGIDDNVVSSLRGKYINVSDSKYEMVRKYQNFRADANEFAFEALQRTDNAIRTSVTLAIADMFHAGKYEGYSRADVEAMSETQKLETLKKIVKIETRSTLTASSKFDKTLLEKSSFGRQLVRYWTDQRNVLNLMFSQGRDVRNQWKDGNHRKSVERLATMQLTAMLMQAYLGSLNPFGEDEEESALETMGRYAGSIPNVALGAIPGISMAMWSVNKSPWTRPSIPAFDIAYRMSKGIAAMPDIVFEDENISKKERQNITTAALAIAGLPGSKFIGSMGESMVEENEDTLLVTPNSIMDNVIDTTKDMLGYFLETLGDDMEPIKEDMREQMDELPQDEESIDSLIDEDTIDMFATVLSENNWRKVDPDTGAAGIYQFTEERWNDIMESNPDLALTDSGRIEKDPTEQHRAMEFSNRENAVTLHNNDVPLTGSNLMGAHLFGVDEFMDIMSYSDNTRMNKILGKDSEKPPFNKFKTVKDMKNYLKRLTQEES